MSSKNNAIGKSYIRIVICLILIAVLFVGGFVFTFSINVVPTGSMESTIMEKDIVLSLRLYGKQKNLMKRGDVVIFKNAEDDEAKYLIKRVIGIGGDELTFADGFCYVNGEKEFMPYISGTVYTSPENANRYLVPEGTIFVMGDNRRNSKDSRKFKNPYISNNTINSLAFFSFGFAGGFHFRFL